MSGMLKLINLFINYLCSFVLLATPGWAFSSAHLAFNEEEVKVVESTLRLSLIRSELGAVLFGGKPVCIEAIEHRANGQILGISHVLLGECYRQFLPIWDRIATKEGPFALVAAETEDGVMPMWINKTAFLSTVEENLSIFQTILGPLMTPAGLLQEFSSDGVDPFEVLRSNKLLFGILLGFGRENSWLHARIETLDWVTMKRIRAPLQPLSCHPKMFAYVPHFLSWDYPSSTDLPRPAPGYSSLTEENEALAKKCSSYSWECPNAKEKWIPLFGCNPASRETKKLLHSYISAADKTERLLAKDHFVSHILAKLLGISKVALSILPSFSSSFPDQPTLHRAIASALVRGTSGTCGQSSFYREGFIAGLRGAEAPPIADPFLAYFEADYADLAHQNLAASDQFFNAIDQGWIEIVPQQLYYRTLTEGAGAPVSKATKTVQISYAITPIEGTSSEDNSYEDTCGRNVQHCLSQLIPGMSHAIVGMRPREMREILVHPAHAYGVGSNFEPGVSLRIKVSLRSHRGTAEPLPSIEKLSLTPPEIKHDLDELLWVLGHQAGVAAWKHLSQAADLIDRDEVIKELSAWDLGDERDIMAFSQLQVELCRRRYGF